MGTFISKHSQKRKTALDIEYNKFIVNLSNYITKEDEERWETYNTIMDELATQNKKECIDEIKYRITDGEDVSLVFSDVLNKDQELSGLLFFLKRRVDEYAEDDYLKNFVK